MSEPHDGTLSGGCQCGAVRFSVERLGRGSICHCRMCQKAFGAFYGPLITSYGVTWTRGAPRLFRSSDRVNRGFCANCGTPLTYQVDGGELELAIGAFDRPEVAAPLIQVNRHARQPFVDALPSLPAPPQSARAAAFNAAVVSYQHPDRDTDQWPAGANR